MSIIDSFVGGDGSAAMREPGRRCAVICAFFCRLCQLSEAPRAEKVGDGANSANGARASLRAWLESQGPRRLSARLRGPSLVHPSPIFRRGAARSRLYALRTRAPFSSLLFSTLAAGAPRGRCCIRPSPLVGCLLSPPLGFR